VSDGQIPYTRLTRSELEALPSGGLPAPSSGRGAWLLAGACGLGASLVSLLVVQVVSGGARLSYWGMRAAFHGFRSPPLHVISQATQHGSSGAHGRGAGLAVIILVLAALVLFAFELLGAKLAACLAIGLAVMVLLARRMDAPMPRLAIGSRSRWGGPPRRRY
jgi:hypothetical protein